MVSEIQKFVNRLSQKEKNVVKIVTEHIIQGNFEGLDLKKMTGHKNIYRVRKGQNPAKTKENPNTAWGILRLLQTILRFTKR
jgi:hypothetical protein